MNLITEYFIHKNANRMNEIHRALKENLQTPIITTIHLLCEHLPQQSWITDNPKIKIISTPQRWNYNKIFRYANNKNLNETIIANNDISFIKFQPPLIEYRQLQCFTRHEHIDGEELWYDQISINGKNKTHKTSQDAWAFRTPIKMRGCNFKMGTLGCDNKLSWIAAMNKNHVTNPGFKSKIIHYHNDLTRKYTTSRIPSPYLYVDCYGHNETVFSKRRIPYKRVKLIKSDIIRCLIQHPLQTYWSLKHMVHLKTHRQKPKTKRYKRKEPILVLQPGKVGSTSLYKELKRIYESPIIHLHSLNYDQNYTELAESLLPQLKLNSIKPFIICPIREPFERNISAFFQNKSKFQSIKFDAYPIPTEDVWSWYVKSKNFNRINNWFDEEICHHFDIDVYSKPMPECGYLEYSSNKANLLVYYYDLPSETINAAVSRFLDIPFFQMSSNKSNQGSQKFYAEEYAHFKNLKFDAKIINDLYSGKYARHFFSHHEKHIREKYEK